MRTHAEVREFRRESRKPWILVRPPRGTSRRKASLLLVKKLLEEGGTSQTSAGQAWPGGWRPEDGEASSPAGFLLSKPWAWRKLLAAGWTAGRDLKTPQADPTLCRMARSQHPEERRPEVQFDSQ